MITFPKFYTPEYIFQDIELICLAFMCTFIMDFFVNSEFLMGHYFFLVTDFFFWSLIYSGHLILMSTKIFKKLLESIDMVYILYVVSGYIRQMKFEPDPGWPLSAVAGPGQCPLLPRAACPSARPGFFATF